MEVEKLGLPKSWKDTQYLIPPVPMPKASESNNNNNINGGEKELVDYDTLLNPGDPSQGDTLAGCVRFLQNTKHSLVNYKEYAKEEAHIYSISAMTSALTLLTVFATVTIDRLGSHRDVVGCVISLLTVSLIFCIISLVLEMLGKWNLSRYVLKFQDCVILTSDLLEEIHGDKTIVKLEKVISELKLKKANCTTDEDKEDIDFYLNDALKQRDQVLFVHQKLPKQRAMDFVQQCQDLRANRMELDSLRTWFLLEFLLMKILIAVAVLLTAASQAVVNAVDPTS